ncbi:MAG TPA: hypothetical protein ENH07_10255 [Nitrospirae bacterium]|nr:hypothetical protein [Nitrospirota bacterium]
MEVEVKCEKCGLIFIMAVEIYNRAEEADDPMLCPVCYTRVIDAQDRPQGRCCEYMKPGDIIACSILALFVLITIALCYNQDMQNGSIENMIEVRVAQEFRERYRNVPRIMIDRGTVYAGDGEIVVEAGRGKNE